MPLFNENCLYTQKSEKVKSIKAISNEQQIRIERSTTNNSTRTTSYEETSSQNSAKLFIVKKREEKKDSVLVCSYCQGAYHLSCLLSNPLL